MGISAAGDRIPGNIPVPPLEPVPPAPALSSFQNCHLELPLADFQDHAWSSEWEFIFCFLEVAATGMAHPSWELPRDPLVFRDFSGCEEKLPALILRILQLTPGFVLRRKTGGN